ncbi:MAG TPA: PilZ domain-containing protein [Candidatus Aquilonibacter sp.]|nr:PilZ domain-containing protein [Candidatus Aquilonibacter sp.]
MPFERHRAPRPSFVAPIDVTELDSEKPLSAHTRNLNLRGCFVETPAPLPKDAKVRVRISHRGATFVAIGKVAYLRPGSGMGIAFLTIDPKSQTTLDTWLASLGK